MKPIFKNRPNQVHIINNKEIWQSRSPVVIGIIFAIKDNGLYVLTEKRSQSMRDEPGKWCCPSGYIDWDETGWDCLRRELYEETGFLIDDYKKYIVNDNNKEPFYVMTHPRECRQNVALNYYVVFNFTDGIFPKEIEKNKSDEVEEIKWISIIDIHKYNWAFEHSYRIKMAIQKINL